MVRKVRNVKLDSRTARSKLPVMHDPYWVSCGPALSLGYRKGAKASSWQARAYDGTKYFKGAIGTPDDALDADGVKVLTFHQAIAVALVWWDNKRLELSGDAPKAGPVTVKSAADAYLTNYKHRGGKDLKSVESRLKLHILPAFGNVEVEKITKPQIEGWVHGLASTPRLNKASKLGLRKSGSLDISDANALRRRRSAANRTLTVLKAILNHAFAANDSITTDKAWRTVKPYPAVDAARERFLSEKEASKLIEAATGPFRDLALAALLTGCRYGELAALNTANIDLDAGTLYVVTSKSGHPRHVVLTNPGVALFRRLIDGRQAQERVFMRTTEAEWRSCDSCAP